MLNTFITSRLDRLVFVIMVGLKMTFQRNVCDLAQFVVRSQLIHYSRVQISLGTRAVEGFVLAMQITIFE